MRMKSLLLVALSVFTVAASAVAATLTRPDAQRAIQKHPDFATTDTIPGLVNPGFDRAVADGLWVQAPSGGGPGGWVPSALGKQYFTSVTLGGIHLIKPLHRAITAITGIADEHLSGEKVAEFTWHFTDLTPSLWKYTGATSGDHSGKATFRLYDDGWRVKEIECDSGRDGQNSRPFVEKKLTPGAKTITDMCSVSEAWYGFVLDGGSLPDGVKTATDIRSKLVPTYLKDVPDKDEWGNPYLFSLSEQSIRFEIRSLGRNGKSDPTIKGVSSNPDADIVLSYHKFISRHAGVPVPDNCDW
jgi:hypothetical protein